MAKDMYVLIATAGRAPLLERTLDSLVLCDKPNIYRATIVVENGPKMGAQAIVTKYASTLNAQYMHVERPNKSHALNQALATIGHGLVFFTDDDVRFHVGVLSSYAEAAAMSDCGYYYGGTTLVDYEIVPPKWLSGLLPCSARGLDLRDSSLAARRNFMGFNWAAFASDILALHGFNTLLGPGSPVGATVGDEADMQCRLRDGCISRIVVPDAVVWHYVPKSRSNFRWTLQRSYRHGLSRGFQSQRRKELLGLPYKTAGQLLKNSGKLLYASIRLNRASAAKQLNNLAYGFGQLQGYQARKRAKY